MSIYRKAAKRDASERLIVDYLRRAGCSVAPVSAKDVPDLIVGYQGVTLLVEVKTRRKKLRPGQERFHEEWRGGPIEVLRSLDEAIELLKTWNQVLNEQFAGAERKDGAA